MHLNNLCPGCMEDRGTDKICPYCGYVPGTAPASAHYLVPGTLLENKYLIGRVLGQGGFGITYIAWDRKLAMKLAIKEYFPQGMAARTPGSAEVDTSSGEIKEQLIFGLQRFLNEAKTLGRFAENPNIVTVRDYFEANSTAYLVMNYVEGVTLEQYLHSKGGRLSFAHCLEIIMPVLDALKEVHRTGILHRDISPDNIFINQDGRVILIDFGAARQEMREKSKSLSVILKAGYAPEEQYRSRGKQGSWTDIYAVAATMYRCITGQVPPEAMDRLDDDELIPPSKLEVTIGPKQEQALLKALAVKAEKRYQNINDFQEELVGKEEQIDMEEKRRAEELFTVEKRKNKPGKQDYTPGELLKGNKKRQSNSLASKLIIFAVIGIVIGLSIIIINQFMGEHFNGTVQDDLADDNVDSLETGITGETRGNSVGNIVNVGIAVQQGEWIYHRKNDQRGAVYKTNIQGTEQYKLNNDDSWNINVVENWLYYSNSAEKWNIYKIGIDGNNRTRINSDDSGNLNVIDDWIYYRNDDDNGSIYKIRVDGSGRTKLNNEQSYFLNVVDGWIYFQNRSDGGSLYKISVDGKERTKLNSDDTWHINVVEDWIYYCAANESSNIYKLRLDGSERTIISNDQSANLNVKNGWLYYRNDDNGSKLYKIRPDGSEKTRLNNDQTFFFSITDDWIYYQNRSDDSKIYRTRLDGSSRQPVD